MNDDEFDPAPFGRFLAWLEHQATIRDEGWWVFWFMRVRVWPEAGK